MKSSAIIRVFVEASVVILLSLAVFVWPVPTLISAKDTAAVLIGGLGVIGASLVVVLYFNWRIHSIAEAHKKQSNPS